MKIACIVWETVGQVGGIATHMNRLRDEAIKVGDIFDILYSSIKPRSRPGLYKERKSIRVKDNWIWCDGEAPHGTGVVQDTIRFLSAYDALVFGFPCPGQTKDYRDPLFLSLYRIEKPKVMYVMDGYWGNRSEWSSPILPYVDTVLCPIRQYAQPLLDGGYTNVIISPFPFAPKLGRSLPKDGHPLMVWPNQWVEVKRIKPFLRAVPSLREIGIPVELYGSGIEYYRLRRGEEYQSAVGDDRFNPEFSGSGHATYIGQVEHDEILSVLQRASFTCNLQGMKTRSEVYKTGSYNNAEVEALWYGAVPVLHSSARNTQLPSDVYLSVESEDEIADKCLFSIDSGHLYSSQRKRRAREFVLDVHLGADRYQDLRRALNASHSR